MAMPVEKLMSLSRLTNWEPSKLETIMEAASKMSQMPLLATTEKEVMARVQQEMREQDILLVERAKQKAKREGKTTRDRITLDLD